MLGRGKQNDLSGGGSLKKKEKIFRINTGHHDNASPFGRRLPTCLLLLVAPLSSTSRRHAAPKAVADIPPVNAELLLTSVPLVRWPCLK